MGEDLQVTGNDGRIDIAAVAETEDVLRCLALTESVNQRESVKLP